MWHTHSWLWHGSGVPAKLPLTNAVSPPPLTNHPYHRHPMLQLQRQVAQLYQAGDYDDALRAAHDCVAASQRVFGNTHPVYASALNNLGAVQKVRRCPTVLAVTRCLFPLYRSLVRCASAHLAWLWPHVPACLPPGAGQAQRVCGVV